MNIYLASVAEPLKFETVGLLLVTAGLLVLAKIVSDLRAEVRSLRGMPGRESKPLQAPAPASLPEAAPEIPADVFTAIASAV